MRQLLFLRATPALLAAAVVSCNQTPMIPDRCTVLLVSYTPRDTTLHIGDTLTMRATLLPAASSCLPGVTTADLRWRAEGTSVVVIDSLTGHLTAIGSGADAVGVFVGASRTTIGDDGVTVAP